MADLVKEIGAIDILCYLFTPAGLKKMFLDVPEFQKIMQWWKIDASQVRGWSPEEFLQKMDAAGVDKVCIPAVKMMRYRSRELIWDVSVEEVAEVTRIAPDRFIGLAGINPFAGRKGLQELEAAVKEYGFKGAYLHTYGFGLPLNDKLYYPYYAKCVELDIPLVTQVGHSAEIMPSGLGRPILLDEVAIDFPELRIVGAHTGWPWVEEMIALAWKHPNVYVGIDAHMPRYLDPSLVNFMKGRGKAKVVYGTNGPLLFTHEETLKQLAQLDLGEDVYRKVLRENALRVLGLRA